MTTIVLLRGVDCFKRSFRVFLNDVEIGISKKGEIGKFEIASGNHKVYLKMDNIKSETIFLDCVEGERIFLEANGNRFLSWFGSSILMSFILFPFLLRYIENDGSMSVFVVVVIVAIPVYFFSFGRKKLLKLKKLDL